MKKRNILCFFLVVGLLFGLATSYFYLTAERFVSVMAPAVENQQLLLIIDAGHGGADGGASDAMGREEDAVNLEIALRLEALAALYGIQTELTRREHDIDYPEDADSIRAKKVADTRRRVEQINAAQYAVVISIHQNTYPADYSVQGTQVLYANTEQSQAFAETMQEALTQGLGLERSRAVRQVPSSVFLLNHIDTVAILVECGFLSNPQEAERLHTANYQLQIAASIFAGYRAMEESLRQWYFGGSAQ